MDKNIALNRYSISVIIPVYNVERYLIRCLDSIYSQKFKGEIQVIAVDDCSTDNSLSILKEYKRKEESLIIIEHEKNKKLSCARNSGILVATGDYIIHVDSDDWLLPNSLQKLYNLIAEKNVDVVVYNYLRENQSGVQVKVNDIVEDEYVTEKEKIAQYFLGGCWNKIVKKEILYDLIYGKVGINSEEDLIYCIEILNKANSFYLTKSIFYAYFDNSTSITNIVKPTGFLNTQSDVLNEISLIFKRYSTNKWLRDFFLDYFEKWIFLSVIRVQFLFPSEVRNCQNVIDQIAHSKQLSKKRIKKIQSSVKCKLVSIFYTYNYFGFRLVASILWKSIKG